MKNRINVYATIALVLVCFAVPQAAQAVIPAPDGGYPGNNTAEGFDALLSLTTGVNNTAIGWSSLKGDTSGMNNTAIGASALLHNTGNGNSATGAGARLSATDFNRVQMISRTIVALRNA